MPRFPFLSGARQRWVPSTVLLLCIFWITAYFYIHRVPTWYGPTVTPPTSQLSQSIPQHPWAPYSLTTCLPNAPPQFAPCQAPSLPHCSLGEELVYPDFEFQMPFFAKEEHRERFVRLVRSELGGRAALVNGESTVRYTGQHGQNYVFEDVAFEPDVPYDSWSDEAAMGGRTSPKVIQPLSVLDPSSEHETLVIANNPDSWSFQHFIDRGARIITQAQHLLRIGEGEDVKVVIGRKSAGPVQQMWGLMGFDEDHLVNAPTRITARRIVWASRTVLIHPWLSYLISEKLGLDQNVESNTRKKVMYVSRSRGGTNNGGRRVINEDDVLEAITLKLKERDQGEELVVFNQSDYATQADLMHDFLHNVIAIIGPHGGGLMNQRFMAHQTSVVEFISSTWTCLENFEEAGVMDQHYGAVVVEPYGGEGTDMEVDPEDAVRLLARGLDSRGSGLRQVYPWQV